MSSDFTPASKAQPEAMEARDQGAAGSEQPLVTEGPPAVAAEAQISKEAGSDLVVTEDNSRLTGGPFCISEMCKYEWNTYAIGELEQIPSEVYQDAKSLITQVSHSRRN